jgi:hypothetical protein
MGPQDAATKKDKKSEHEIEVREGRRGPDEPAVKTERETTAGKVQNRTFASKKGGRKGWVSVQTRKKRCKKR